jgi:hypothetical protein
LERRHPSPKKRVGGPFLRGPPPTSERDGDDRAFSGQLWPSSARWRVFVDHQSNHHRPHMTPAYYPKAPFLRGEGTVDPPTGWARRECWMGPPPQRDGSTQRPPRACLQPAGSGPSLAEPNRTRYGLPRPLVARTTATT